MEISPETMPWQSIYKLMIGSIVPRPIGWISTVDEAGLPNLAPFSFFTAAGANPPHVLFAPMIRDTDGQTKDTVHNARTTGEFVWNLATMTLANQMNATSASVPKDVSEFELAGLSAIPSTRVKAPRVGESPVSFECRVTQILQLTDQQGNAMPNWMVFGEVVAVHIAKHLLVDGIYDTAAARPILRAGGADAYAQITPEIMFRMARPT